MSGPNEFLLSWGYDRKLTVTRSNDGRRAGSVSSQGLGSDVLAGGNAGDGDGAVQVANAVMLGLGVAGLTMPGDMLPGWVVAGLHAGGFLLASD